MDWKKLFKGIARVGKVTAKVVLEAKFPVAMQIAEHLLGSGTGEQKMNYVIKDALAALEAKAAAGQLEGPMPTVDEIKALAQQKFNELVEEGELEEVSTLTIGGRTYRVIEVK